ncbi:MAG: sulfotransferase family 2 domain-containing protein [Vicinamibacteria bacterium]
MIISHRHRFIFLKTRKTASTSFDIALSRYCGPDDTITRLNSEDEELRGSLNLPGPQNYRVPVRHWTARDSVKFILRKRVPSYTQHMSARSLRARIGRKVWDTYLKFCVERNPYDKAISLYYWRMRHLTRRPPLLEFLRSVDDHSLSNFHIYGIRDRIEVDHVIRYEKLEEGIDFLSSELGLDGLALPRAKSGFRPDRRSYRQVMTGEERQIVSEVCAREIQLLSYDF